jgi:hypothetical protein
MINLNLPNSLVDKSLADLIYHKMSVEMEKIKWDLRSLMAAPIVVQLVNGIVRPNLVLQAHMKLTNGKTLGCRAEIDHIRLLRDEDRGLQAIALEAEALASELIGGILKEYGTSISDERKKMHEEWLVQKDHMMENHSYYPLPIIIADPSVPPDTILAVDGKTGEVLKRLDLKESIKGILEERKKNAKWKIE